MIQRLFMAVLCILAALCVSAAAPSGPPRVRIGSKVFTESVILGDIAAQVAQSTGADAEHRRQLGGTRLLWNALVRGDLDIYPEYTGTLTQEILANRGLRDPQQLRAELAKQGIGMTDSLGFNDTYAIGMRADVADRMKINTVSHLLKHPELRLGFSNEFMDRKDGWPGMRDRYRLAQRDVRGMDHDLAYRAIQSGSIDATDLYSTDAEIRYYHLRVLDDDLHYFPDYQAVYLYRMDLAGRAPKVIAAMEHLQGRISQQEMIALNARAKLDHTPEPQVASEFLTRNLGIAPAAASDSFGLRLLQRTREHLYLVSISLAAAILFAIPLGVIAARYAKVGHVILGVVAIIYTIPSLALLVFMIPLLGIGAWPATVALFLYSLLPIVRNTHEGLREIPEPIRESAEALGLPAGKRLWWIELPMASGAILAGIKTAAVINVGTATLGALIGAGGYGQPILTGIRLDRVSLILEGAIPAALLALAVQFLFELIERLIVPRTLRAANQRR